MTSIWGTHDREADGDRFDVHLSEDVVLPEAPLDRLAYFEAAESLRGDATTINEAVARIDGVYVAFWDRVDIFYELNYAARRVDIWYVATND